MAKIVKPAKKGGKAVVITDKERRLLPRKRDRIREENAHITETAPKNLPRPAGGVSATAYVPGGTLSRNDVIWITETAWDAQEFRSLDWAELDGSYQRTLFDVATDICLRGGATTVFEQSVADTFVQFAAGEIGPDIPPDPPVEDEQLFTPLPSGELTPGLFQRQVEHLDGRLRILEGTATELETRDVREARERQEDREANQALPSKPYPDAPKPFPEGPAL